MSIFYAKAEPKALLDFKLFCEQFSQEVDIIASDCLCFQLEDAQRISLYLNFESFQAEMGISVNIVEGIDEKSLMMSALDFLSSHRTAKILNLHDVFLLSIKHQESSWIHQALSLLDKVPNDVLQTADMYVLALGNAVLAAQLLYLHRNTFNYRLNKFTLQSKINLKDPNLSAFYHAMRTFSE